MTFFRAFATLAPLLALRGASLRSSRNGSSMCPCIGEHLEFAKARLVFHGLPHDQFGIGCGNHNIGEDFAVLLYQSHAATQLKCGVSSESPWCGAKWCYVHRENCHLNWDWGVLGQPYSYATCGNLRQGSDKYFQKSMAAFLQGDALRVFHPENSLVGGYLGNTECHDHYYPAYLTHQKCKGQIAKFWGTTLDELNQSQVQVNHTVIRGGENGIDPYFIDFKNAFEEYKERFPKHWARWPSNNFDLCAFATGLGYVDLCTGAFSLTDRRQAMTFVIELYTSPVFMVSKSTCDFLGSDDWGSKRFWLWWWMVFSPEAWLFFASVVLFFILAMKGLDKYLENEPEKCQQSAMDKIRKCFYCLTHGIADAFKSNTEPEEPEEPDQAQQSAMLFLAFAPLINFKSCTEPEESEDLEDLEEQEEPEDKGNRFDCFWSITRSIADALVGVFEAFVFKSKTSHRRLSKKPKISRSSHMLRLGLGFFILVSTTLYASSITSRLVSAHQVKGEFESFTAARDIATDFYRKKNITLCTNSALKEALEIDENDNFLLGLNTWEEVLTGLKGGTCNAALLTEEAWKTFRNRGELCDFYQNPTPEFYLPQGAVVSKRAYRTLETFRFAPGKFAVFLDKAGDSCHGTSAEALCDNKGGVPWYTLFSLFVVAAACGLCSLLGILHKKMGGQDSESDEAEENHMPLKPFQNHIDRRSDQKSYTWHGGSSSVSTEAWSSGALSLQTCRGSQGSMLPPIPPDPSASMQQLQATAKFALEMLQDSRAQEQKNKQILDEISQVLRQSDPRPQAEVAGPAKPDGPESQDRQDLESQNLTGEPSTMNPTFLRHEFRHPPQIGPGSKYVGGHAQIYPGYPRVQQT